MNAIFCLTRGYPNVDMYWKLIKRNETIVQSIGTNHDIIIFHEGNIQEEHQRFVQSKTPSLNIMWIQVPWYFPQGFQIPKESYETWLNGSCYPGYHLMCHFHTCDVWDYVKNYDKILRIDEDCFLEGNWSEIFDIISEDVPFKAAEGGGPTWGMHNISDVSLQEHFNEIDMKTLSVYSTQVFVSFTKFWYTPEVISYINRFKKFDGSRKWRWGDQETYAIIFRACNIKVETFDNFRYYHESHKKFLN